jgi:tyrosyl-tRNA synthetase
MTSPDLRDHLSRPQKAYVGFDPTADSLHLGNLVGIVALEWMRKCGHTPVVVLGGATGRIGDPSGKSSERPRLREETLESNVRSLRAFFDHLFQGLDPQPVIVNNDDWFREFTLIEFLRDVGKLFRIGPMIAKESVKARLNSEEGMSFTEFSYQILQSYDFAHLHGNRGVSLQMGGSDQWGNITAGIEYNRKSGGGVVYGLTFPLLVRSDGKKFGKSEEGAIWLSKEKLSPYQFYQYLIRVPDADVIRLLSMLTFLEMDEIRRIEKQMQEPDYAANSAQKRLAEEVTRFVHGDEGVQSALKVTEGIAPGGQTELSGQVLQELIRDMPHGEMKMEEVVGVKAVDLFVKTGLASSKSEVVRLIKNGGAYLNNKRVGDPAYTIASSDLLEGTYLMLSAGKKKKFLVSAVNNYFEK